MARLGETDRAMGAPAFMRSFFAWLVSFASMPACTAAPLPRFFFGCSPLSAPAAPEDPSWMAFLIPKAPSIANPSGKILVLARRSECAALSFEPAPPLLEHKNPSKFPNRFDSSQGTCRSHRHVLQTCRNYRDISTSIEARSRRRLMQRAPSEAPGACRESLAPAFPR